MKFRVRLLFIRRRPKTANKILKKMSEIMQNGVPPSSIKNLLSKSSVRVDPQACSEIESKLSRLIENGSNSLQVIADFDFTLSSYCCKDGSRAMSTHAVFENTENDVISKKQKGLLEKYIPIEYHADMTVEEKIPYMLEWWQTSHDLIVSHGYTKESLKNLVINTKQLIMRDGFVELFNLLEKHNVPIIIFSAGIGDIIEIVVKHTLKKMPSNVHIISNWMIFDENDQLIGFKDPILHSFNKNSSAIKEEEKFFFEKLHSRPNVLLLGDTLGDAGMDMGLEVEQTVLKIGFLNTSTVKNRLESYIETFDMICVEDPTLDVPLHVLEAILGKKKF